MDVEKAQRVSLLHFLTQNCFKNLNFRLHFFFSLYPQIIFLNAIRNFDVISGLRRHIRILDVISELHCVLLKRGGGEARKQALPFVPAHYTRSNLRCTEKEA